jgi:hypothetical protein
MTRQHAKEITMPVLLRIAKQMPVKGFLAEVGSRRQFFGTMPEALNWIHSQPTHGCVPTVSFGYYTHVIIHCP